MNVAYHCRVCNKDWPGDWYDGPCCDKSDPVALPPAKPTAESVRLNWLLSELADAEDVRDGPDGQQLPNLVMSILAEYRRKFP